MFRLNLWAKPFLPAGMPLQHPGMENTTYLPNPLASPALMVLASTAEAARDTQAHIQAAHHFSGQNLDKDMPVPYSNAAGFPGFRQGEHLPPPIYSPMHGHFVRPNMERALGLINPGGGGAFRPVCHSGDSDTYHSAFLPTKRSKVDDNGLTPTYSSENLEKAILEKDESHPPKASPLIKEERPDSHGSASNDRLSDTRSEGGDSWDRSTPDEGRHLRRARKRSCLDGETPCCPVCSITLRKGELEQHLSMELEKLQRITRIGKKSGSRDSTPQGRKSQASPSTSRRGGRDSPPLESASCQSRYETYMRVKANRQTRLSVKSRAKKKRAEEVTCPICSIKLNGTPEEVNAHAEECLKKQRLGSEEALVDVEGGGFEEYEWAGQTRVRVTSMVEGGMAALGYRTHSSSKAEEEDVDLNVDGDDSEQYGRPQFSERDVIPCSSDEPSEEKERQALRGALLTGEEGERVSENATDRNRWTSLENGNSPGEGRDQANGPSDAEQFKVSEVLTLEVIESLKAKVREHEDHVKAKTKFKCLICMEHYSSPLTSIQCWHVYCEECWLRTLGAKKLCPQCNMITSPSDLRKIYV